MLKLISQVRSFGVTVKPHGKQNKIRPILYPAVRINKAKCIWDRNKTEPKPNMNKQGTKERKGERAGRKERGVEGRKERGGKRIQVQEDIKYPFMIQEWEKQKCLQLHRLEKWTKNVNSAELPKTKKSFHT